ncbi:flagellar hook-basal body protein [Thermoproteota archaeon]
MITQLHVAKSAMFAYERNMQIIADNIANAQSIGFKERRLELENTFPLTYERVVTEYEEGGAGRRSRIKELEYGNGVHIATVSKNFTEGSIEITNRPLDLAVTNGNGLFQFRLPDGTIAYSRAGNLHLDREGNIVSANGHAFEPPLRIPEGVSDQDIFIDDQGVISVLLPGESTMREVGQIMLASFINPAGLRDIGQNLLQESAASGQPRLDRPGREGIGKIQPGALEFSNVNIIEQMMEMIMTQRMFDVAVKAVNACDVILKKGWK